MWSKPDTFYYFFISVVSLIINHSKNIEIPFSRDYYYNSLKILLCSFQQINYSNTSKQVLIKETVHGFLFGKVLNLCVWAETILAQLLIVIKVIFSCSRLIVFYIDCKTSFKHPSLKVRSFSIFKFSLHEQPFLKKQQ